MVYVFDVDDTLSDTNLGTEKYILNYFKTNSLPYKMVHKYAKYADYKFDWSEEVAKDWFHENSDEMMLNFKVKKNVKKVLEFLRKNGDKIVIATARDYVWHKNPEQTTATWMKNKKLPYDKIYVNTYEKQDVCIAENADVFVDDSLEMCEKVAKSSNAKVFLITTGYNKDFSLPENISRISDISEILTYKK